jgi:hypothetical protein
MAFCQGKDRACPAVATDQNADLGARTIGREAIQALKVVLGEAARRREGKNEAGRHDLVPQLVYQIYVIPERMFNQGFLSLSFWNARAERPPPPTQAARGECQRVLSNGF